MKVKHEEGFAAPSGGPRRQHATAPLPEGDGSGPDRFSRHAVAALWTLCDDAYRRLNERAAVTGMPCRVSTTRMPDGRRCWLAGEEGSQRSIAVDSMLSVIEGRVHGGAFIRTSRPYLSLFVVPVAEQHQIGWRVGTNGVPLTPALIDDLFQGVLAGEEEAARRLARLTVYALG